MEDTEANCRQVLENLYQYLDGEISAAECTAVEEHLEVCARCLGLVGFERELKQLVHRTCSVEHAPPELQERVRAALARLGQAAE